MNAEAVRVGALYVPVLCAALAYRLRKPQPRQFAAVLLAVLWAMPALVALQRMNQLAGWWSYGKAEVELCGMPLELLLGWTVLWGIVPQLWFARWPVWRTVALMGALDLLLMPRLGSVVLLNPSWLVGEAVAVVFVLLPAVFIAKATLLDTHLRLRAGFQAATAGLLFFYFLPEVVFALRPGAGWSPLLHLSRPAVSIAVQAMCLAAAPGIWAVREFAEAGRGTPIPYDPPQRLVTSGPYRYVANPMQLSCMVTLLVWAVVLRSGWYSLAAGAAFAYSAGLAAWDEGTDMSQRFGDPWRTYRSSVRDWLPRWRPFHNGPEASIYIARTCGPCSEVRRWVESQDPIGLRICDAEALPQGTTQRILYESADGSLRVNGIRAVAHVFEHINLLYALLAALLFLPGMWQCVQALMDVAGLGPRAVVADSPAEQASRQCGS